MSDGDPCPTDAVLRALHARELDETVAGPLSDHIGGCASCAKRMSDLEAEHETWIRRLRQAGPPPAAARPPHLAADAIAGYELLEPLHTGGQGTVYRARQVQTRRTVALKVLREGRFASEASRRRFEREIELCAGLRHPGLVVIFDSGFSREGLRYYAMDLVDGVPLTAFAREHDLALERRVELVAAVCDAVNHAHQRSVLHRDLKPSNVLVDGEGRPRVLDFGLALHLDDVERTAVTQSGFVPGTLPYMSPEQARGSGDEVDVRTDVYAIGVMLYELLTGTFPYPVDGPPLETLRVIAETPPASAVGRGAEPSLRVDRELDTILMRALAKEPDRRYPTAGDLARDLRHYLAGEPIDARRDSSWYVLRKTMGRYKLLVAAAAALFLTVSAASIALGFMYARQRELRNDAEEQAHLATRRFDQVRDLARTFILDVDPLIKRVPGTAAARSLLVSKGLEYLDTLSAEAPDDPRLRLELAVGYVAIGDVQGAPNSANLGDTEGALTSYDDALAILEQLASVTAVSRDARRNSGLARAKRAEVMTVMGRPGAWEESQAALAMCEALAEEYPDDYTVQRDLAVMLGRVGNAIADKDLARAVEYQQRSMALSQELARRRPPDDWEAQRDVTVGFADLARLHIARGDRDAAIEAYRTFLDRSREQWSKHPDNMVARRDVVVGHQWLGILHAESDRPEEAIIELEQCTEAAEQFMAAAPDDADMRIDAITCYTRLGEARLARGDVEGARNSFARLVTLAETQARVTPDRPRALRLRGVAYYKMHELHALLARAGDAAPDAAIAEWEASRRWLDKALASFIDMEERHLLAADDAGVPEMLRQEIAQCDAALAQLATPDVAVGAHPPVPPEPDATAPE